ncbi:MAG: M14 family metallopeptidase [bacterium]|nr:M14 family metallopeptidase [bacterium]
MVRPLLALLVAVVTCVGAASPQVPSPEQFLGHVVGADYRLCNYTDMVRYFRAVEQASDRCRLVDIGESSYGQRMLMAVISSPQNLARIERLREICQKLSKGRGVDELTATAFAEEGRAFIWIDAGLHATEAIAGQNILELVWQMTSRNDREVKQILDEVVLLACPVNPDGYELIANAYRATRSMTIPVLYQRFVGHDNNRDFYACNQVETQNVTRVFYDTWCPQIVYNHHQSAPRGTIMYTPPFRDPLNYHMDPMVARGIELVSAHMNSRFAYEGKPGIISESGASYSAWWNGGLRTINYFHNVIGILTESFGRPEPTEIKQTLRRRLPYGDYPDPVKGQIWHARQTIEYMQTANFAILDYAARYRRELLHGMWRMATRSIERGSRDHWTPTPRLLELAKEREEPDSVFADPALRDPRFFVMPRDQRDWAAACRFVRALARCGVEVHRTRKPFELAGRAIPVGSFLVSAAQAYRPHVMDMFEPQWHPDDTQNGKPVPPYDAAGWTLAMQCGVEVVRGFEAVPEAVEVVDAERLPGTSLPDASANGWLLAVADSHTPIAVNRLLAAGCEVARTAAGDYRVARSAAAARVLATLATSHGLRASAANGDARAGEQPVLAPRVGLFDVFGGHMPTGWDQWVLEEYGFSVAQVFGDRIEAGDLGRDFDVLIFHTGLPGPRDLERAMRRRNPPDFDKLAEVLPPFEDWSNLKARATKLTGDKSLPAIREFVEGGGTLLALGEECEKVIRHFDLPVKVGVYVPSDDPAGEEGDGERRATREEFYCPGSLLAATVDTEHPLAAGCPAELAMMVRRRSKILEVTDESAPIDVVAAYRGGDTLLSGWGIGVERLVGKAVVLSARSGRGRIVLYGADVTYRGQPIATFRLVFNAILAAGRAR